MVPAPGNGTTGKVFVTQRTPPGEGKKGILAFLSPAPLLSSGCTADTQHAGELGPDTEAVNTIQPRDLFLLGVGSPVAHRVIHPVPVPSLLWAEGSDNITANSNYLHSVLKSRHSHSIEPGRSWTEICLKMVFKVPSKLLCDSPILWLKIKEIIISLLYSFTFNS